MKLEQCALQLYTLRERMKTRADLETTLARVKEIGYPAIQISGLDWGLLTEAEMVELCAEIGLVICATHEPSDTVLDAPEQVVQRLQALGCGYTSYPYPGGIDFGDAGQVEQLIQGLERSGKILAEAGLVLSYHNHHLEFRKLGGTTIYERIFAGTNPAHLQAELDTYWVQYGGADPVDWCRRLKGRLPVLHLKDYGINADNEIAYCEIGAGNLNFRAIIAAAEASGCQWFIVEQDTCPGDEFDSVAESFDYIQRALVSSD